MLTKYELRQAIETALGDLLGTYTLPDGATEIDAVSILPDSVLGYDYPPPGTVISGLEVAVLWDSELTTQPLTGQGNYTTSVVRIELKQWDESATLSAAIDALIATFGGAITIGPRILPVDSLGNIETCSITLSQSFKIRSISGV